MPDQSITLTARAFHDLVNPVLPLAAKDGQLPVINAVLIEHRGGHLVATATDRFRIGVCRRRYEMEKSSGFRALIPLPHLRSILALFKPARRTDNTLTLTIEDSRIYAEASGGLGFDFSDMRVGYELERGEFPGVNTMICETLANEPTSGTAGMSAAFLADWRHAGDTVEVKITAPNEPVIVRAGDHFLGLLMPKNLVPGETVPADDWAEFLADKPAPTRRTRAKKVAA